MKTQVLALVTGALLWGVQATALADGAGKPVTASTLVEFCAIEETDANHGTAVAFCYGYIDAALDYHAAITSGPAFAPLTCPPGTVTREEVAEVVVSWAADNPDQVGEDTPVHVVMQALADKWPCGKH